MNIFEGGERVNLNELLISRENRSENVKLLLQKYNHTVINFHLNIPGPIKNSQHISRIFDECLINFYNWMPINQEILEYSCVENTLNTGPEFYGVIIENPVVVKMKTINFEETFKWGRLLDIDVFDPVTKLGLSRNDLQIQPRKCLICNDTAKVCGRGKKHNLQELYAQINRLIKNNSKE